MLSFFSSLSVILNSCATVIIEDFTQGFFGITLSDRKATIVAKIVSVIFGIISVAFLFIVRHLGGVLGVEYNSKRYDCQFLKNVKGFFFLNFRLPPVYRRLRLALLSAFLR